MAARGPYKTKAKAAREADKSRKSPPRKRAPKKTIEQHAEGIVPPVDQPPDPVATVANLTRDLQTVERALKVKQAQQRLQPFIEIMMTDPEHPDNVTYSLFETEPHHRLLIEAMEAVIFGRMMRSAYSVPPQHGKSTIISRYGVAWAIGRNPHLRIIVGTYGEEFAGDVGSAVRDILLSPIFKQIFPRCVMKTGSKSKTHMEFEGGGSITFVGRGTATTGRPCDLFIIDDPYKDRLEGQSAIVRKVVKEWYSAVVFSRCHVLTPIMIVHTRWHEDDLIGWLCDPDHPEHDKKKSAKWAYINIPAIVEDEALAAALGVAVGSALWPKRFPLHHLNEAKENDPVIFAALYMGKPSPDEGTKFLDEMIATYNHGDLPKSLRYYAASDHAVGTKQRNDETCLLIVGVDSQGGIWLVDCWWKRAEPDIVVEAMVSLMKKWKPIEWYAENGHITKSIGPFLYKRMKEERVFRTIVVPKTPVEDKETRSQSIRGFMGMGMVRFPKFAAWFAKARAQLLKFPSGAHDDFVDALSHLGMSLDEQMPAKKKPDEASARRKTPRVGTMAWIKHDSNYRRRRETVRKNLRGM